MTIKNLFRFARLAPARTRRPARPAAPLSLEGLEERRLLAADMPMPTDGSQPLATDSHAGHAMDLSQATVTIMPLGASRVAGGRPAFESYRYELWNDLTARGWAVDFIGTQSDDAAYPELASRSFDTDHEGRSGWTSGDILADLGGWLAETGSPDIVLVSSPGGNDLLEGLDYGQTLANINGIIDLLQQDNPGVTVIVEQPAPGRSDFMTAELTAAFAQLRDDVAGIAASQSTADSQVVAVDMSVGFTDAMLADDIHYNQAGAEFVAARYTAALEPFLAPPAHGDMPHAGDPARQGEHMAAMGLADPAAATHRVVASGPWSSPETWADGVLPTVGARVLVPAGLTVTVDGVFATELKTLRVDGSLRFDPTVNTELRVDTLVSAMGSLVEIGTPARPVQADVTATVVFADLGPIDLSVDPGQLGRGAIFHGTTRIHGAAKTSFTTLATPPRAGDTVLELAAAPEGWQVGDRLVIAGTRADATGEETVTITGIAGATVSFDQPLRYDHLPPRADLAVHVANLTRNVVFTSENPALDRRGHVMFMHNPDVQVANAAFNDLGRTNKLEILDPPYFDEEGEFVEGTGRNATGRYSVHFHRTGIDASRAPATVTGSVVAGNPGWGYVNHSSHVDFTDNVAYDVTGAAFNTEAGDEIGSFVGNLAIKMHGSREEPQSRQIHGDFGHAGDGFWLQGPGVRVENNIVSGATGSGLILYAEALFEDGLGITTFASANLPDPAAAEGADNVPVTLAPLAPFSGNTAYGSELGAQIYYHRTFIVIEEEQEPQAALQFQPSVMEDLQLWGNANGMRINYTVDTIFRNIEIIGPADGLGDTGFDALNFYNRGTHRYENLQIEGYEVGFSVPRSGVVTVDGGRFDNLVDFMVTEPRQLGRRLLFTGDIAFGDLETGVVNGETIERVHFEMDADQRPAADSANEHYFLDDQVLLDFGPYGGEQLYFFQQAADHVLFPEMPEQITPDEPGPEVGEEIIGLTNAEIQELLGLSVGGAIVPADAVEVERMVGLLGTPATDLPELDPNPLPGTDDHEDAPVVPGDPDDPAEPTEPTEPTEPVEIVHDPSQLVMRNDGLLVFASSGTEGASLQTWVLDPDTGLIEAGDPVFADGVPAWTTDIQTWNPTGEFDAPAMPTEDVLYYTVFDESDAGIQDAIGRAHREDGVWIDDGIVVRSAGEGDHPRAMDPAVFTDNAGQPWLVFGSHAGGIFIAQLDAETGKLAERPDDPWCDDADDDRFTLLARSGDGNEENTIEAATVVSHDDWYYLLVNWGRCCAGVESTYEIRMGRSQSPTGPFLDAAGVPLAAGGGTLLLGSEGSQIGPGHAGVTEIDREDVAQSVLSYHFYDGETGGTARLGLRELTWQDGWPVVGDALAVTTSPVSEEPGDDPDTDTPPADPLPGDDDDTDTPPADVLATMELPEEGGRFRLVIRDGELVVRQGRRVIDKLPLDGVRELMVAGSPAADQIQVNFGELEGLELERIGISGGDGDDQIRIRALDDAFVGLVELAGDDGDDQLVASRSDLPVTLDGGAGNDRLVGGTGDDLLLGGEGADRLHGGRGDDNLFGGAGDDQLFGGRGDDNLFGGAGEDQLKGGRGNDEIADDDDALPPAAATALQEPSAVPWSVLWSEADRDGAATLLLEHADGALHRLLAADTFALAGLFDRLGNAFAGELMADARGAAAAESQPVDSGADRQAIEAADGVALSRDEQGQLFANDLPMLFGGVADLSAWQQANGFAGSWQPLAAEVVGGEHLLLIRDPADGNVATVRFDGTWQQVEEVREYPVDAVAARAERAALAEAFAVEFDLVAAE